MSISGSADLFTVSTERGSSPLRWDVDAPVAMQLMADGVPLALLVDLALPFGLDFDVSATPEGPGGGSHTSLTS